MEDGNVAVLTILDSQNAPTLIMSNYTNHTQTITQEEIDTSESNKQNVIWTKNATITLLSLYENKTHMMDNPKKKTKMWSSIADDLRTLNIEVTADQVRWKINALTKKYKDCIEKGQGQTTFKYFNEMHQILGHHSDDSGNYRLASGVHNQQDCDGGHKKFSLKNGTPFRRLRSERKAKIELDKQWLEYLKNQEVQKQARNERHERSLRLREEELELRKKELEMKHSIALNRLQLRQKKLEQIFKIEREKCALLKQLLDERESGN